MPQHSNIGVPEEEDKKNGHEKILEKIIVENFPKMGKEIATQVQETQNPKQDKPKAKHPKTHTNQINKDQTQRTNIKSSKGKMLLSELLSAPSLFINCCTNAPTKRQRLAEWIQKQDPYIC